MRACGRACHRLSLGGVPSRPSSFSSRTQLSLPTARSERNDSELSHHAYPQQRKLSHSASQMMPPTLGEAEMTPAPKRPAPIIGRRSCAPSRSPDRTVPAALRNRPSNASVLAVLRFAIGGTNNAPSGLSSLQGKVKKTGQRSDTPARCRLVNGGVDPASGPLLPNCSKSVHWRQLREPAVMAVRVTDRLWSAERTA